MERAVSSIYSKKLKCQHNSEEIGRYNLRNSSTATILLKIIKGHRKLYHIRLHPSFTMNFFEGLKDFILAFLNELLMVSLPLDLEDRGKTEQLLA